MKKIKFTSDIHHASGYGCNEPGDNSGEYVLLSESNRQLLYTLKSAARIATERWRGLMAWSFVADCMGVSPWRAKELCEDLDIDPYSEVKDI